MQHWVMLCDDRKRKRHRQGQREDHFLWLSQQDKCRSRLGGHLDFLLPEFDEFWITPLGQECGQKHADYYVCHEHRQTLEEREDFPTRISCQWNRCETVYSSNVSASTNRTYPLTREPEKNHSGSFDGVILFDFFARNLTLLEALLWLLPDDEMIHNLYGMHEGQLLL